MGNTLVLGLPGSGKTTFARRLSRATGARHIEADKLFWPEPERFRERLRRELGQSPWIYEGHYGKARDLVDPGIDTVFHLDYSYPLVLRRWIARSLRTCDFGDWKWVIIRRRAQLELYRSSCEALERHGKRIVRLANPAEAERFFV